MKPAKQIVFRYNGDERRGMRWKVVQVITEASVSEPFQARIHRVFLTNEI
jgi:hypothetical protein